MYHTCSVEKSGQYRHAARMLYLLKSKNPEYWDDAGRQRLVEASSEQEARQIASEEPISVEPSNYWSDPAQTSCTIAMVRKRRQ